MRRLLALAFAAVSALACTEEDPAPFYVDMEYQVRCVECEPRAADDPVRDVMALDGERGFAIECSVAERGGDRLLTFSAVYTDEESADRNYGVSLIQANLDGDPGGSCLVVVTEGSNTYEGGCTADAPDADNPCQLDLEADGDIVTGTILCEQVSNKSSSTTRHVVEAGELDPAPFEVHGCTGL